MKDDGDQMRAHNLFLSVADSIYRVGRAIFYQKPNFANSAQKNSPPPTKILPLGHKTQEGEQNILL